MSTPASLNSNFAVSEIRQLYNAAFTLVNHLFTIEVVDSVLGSGVFFPKFSAVVMVSCV